MLNLLKLNQQFIILCFALFLFSCSFEKKSPHKVSIKEDIKAEFEATLKKHLDAVSNKDIESLKQTLSPSGKMQLTLPASEVLYTVDEFVQYHMNWFAIQNNWTFDTKVLNTKIGYHLGTATVEILYREPERNGVPYFNRMSVSYVLERVNDQWYVIKDHASSIEKSTDKQK